MRVMVIYRRGWGGNDKITLLLRRGPEIRPMDERRTAGNTELFLVCPNEIWKTERLWNCRRLSFDATALFGVGSK